jgi:hypothetical protein
MASHNGMKAFVTFFFANWWLPPCFGVLTMFLPLVWISNETWLLFSTCLLGLAVYTMICSVYKLSRGRNGLKILATCLCLLPAILELGAFTALLRTFGSWR